MFGGKTAEGFFGQVVRFVYAIETVFGRRQNHAAAHADVGKQKIVVGNDDIDGFQNIARQVKRAFRTIRTGGFQAAVAVVGHFEPNRVIDFFRPSVAVAIKAAGGKFIGNVTQQVQFFRLGFAVPQHFRRFKTKQVLLGVVLRQLIEFVGAKITAAPFGKRKGQLQTAFFDQKRQISVNQLLLQSHRRAADNQPFAARLRHDAAGQKVGQRFTHTGRPFDHGNALALAFGRFFAFFTRQRPRKSVGNCRNHFPLRSARTETGQVFADVLVMVADGVFF